MPRMQSLTDDEILSIARKHCDFTPDGTYHLRRYSGGWAIAHVVRECFELAELCRQAEALQHAAGVVRSAGEDK